MRGIGPVRILQEIESRTSRNIGDIFDLVVGTSTGGIVACLAAAGVPMLQAREFYFEHGPKIFRGSFRRLASGGGMFGPRYDSMDLASALTECIGGTLMRQARTRCMVTTMTDLGSAEMVKSWDPEWADCPLSVAALMTSSAQTYFPPAKIMHSGRVQHYLDGGNVRNAPMACAAFEAGRLWASTGEDILLLHLGTGKPRNPDPLPHGGALAWAPRLFDAVTSGDDSYDDYFCRGLTEFLPQFKYERLDFMLPKFPAMDDASRVTLEDIAHTAWQATLADWPRFRRLIEIFS